MTVNSEDAERLHVMDVDQELVELRLPAAHFNIFEATGDVRHELNHSHFLYYLLNPQSNHGLQDGFIKDLLQSVFPVDDFASTFNGLSGWSVYREYSLTDEKTGEQGRVDIVLLHEQQGLAVIIENKIDSDEHANQLDLYYRVLKGRGWETKGVYLTPDGRHPRHNEYVPISYRVVCSAIDEILADEAVVGDVRTLITHYLDMVRRHIVDEQGIDAACQRIYRRHEQALKLVQQRVSARQTKIGDVVERLVRQQLEHLVSQPLGQKSIDNCIHNWKNPQNDVMVIRFVLPTWKDVPLLSTEEYSPILKTILEFGVANAAQEVYINLQIGPGDDRKRHRIFDLADNKMGLFTVEVAPKKYSEIYHRTLLSTEQYVDLSEGALVQEVENQWDSFVQEDFPRINDAIGQWIIVADNN